jgi:CDP-diacylglycerol--glycerol-3-phosphate 3-phosphatidyltransferase
MSPLDIAALALTMAILATMPLFALRSRGRARDADVIRRPTTLLLPLWVRDWLMWLISPMERLFVRSRVSPDVFNYLGAAFGIAAAAAFISRQLALAGWLILFGGTCDIFDGRIARARGIANSYGAFLDSTLDRFAETFTFLGVAWYLSATPWTVFVSVLAICGSLLVSYTRARGEALGVNCNRGVMQRAERVVLLGLASIFDSAAANHLAWVPGRLLAFTVTLIGVGSFGTALYRTAYITRALKTMDAQIE